MRKTLVTILCLALIAASSIQAAAAAEHHHTRKASRKPVMVNDQRRNSNNEQPRDSNVGGTCGIFPGPCQWETGAGEWQFQSLRIGAQYSKNELHDEVRTLHMELLELQTTLCAVLAFEESGVLLQRRPIE
jgi:hypothetical protein